LFLRSLELLEKTVGDGHSDEVRSLNDLAAIYEDRGDYSEAERLYRRAVKLIDDSQDRDESARALLVESLSNLGCLLRLEGRYEQSGILLQRALKIAVWTFGAAGVQAAGVLNQLDALYQLTGRFDEAASCYRQTYAIYEKTLGLRHPHTIACRENYASLLKSTTVA